MTRVFASLPADDELFARLDAQRARRTRARAQATPEVAERLAGIHNTWGGIGASVALALARAGIEPTDPRIAEVAQASHKKDGGFSFGSFISSAGRLGDSLLGGVDEAFASIAKPVLRGAALGAQSLYEEGQGVIRNVAAISPEAAGAGVGALLGSIVPVGGTAAGAAIGGALGAGLGFLARDEVEGEARWELQSSAAVALERLLSGEKVDLGSGFLPNVNAGESEEDPDSTWTIGEEQRKRARNVTVGELSLTPGRLLAAGVVEPGSRPFNALSGLVDASLALSRFDPASATLRGVGNVNRNRKLFTAAGGILSDRPTILPEIAQDWWAGQRPLREALAADNDMLSIHRATGGQLGARMEYRLSKATTVDEVDDIVFAELGTTVRGKFGYAEQGYNPAKVLGFRGGVETFKPFESIRILKQMPGTHIDLVTGTDRAVNEATTTVRRWLENQKASDTEISEAMSLMAGAETVVGREQALSAALKITENRLRALGVDPERARAMTAWERNASDSLGKFNVQDIADDIVIPGVNVDETWNLTTSPHLPSEVLNRVITLPDARDIRRAISGFSAITDKALYKDAVSAVDFAQGQLWKKSALLRGAYTVRVLGEEQFRMAASGFESLVNHPMSLIAYRIGRKGEKDAKGNVLTPKAVQTADDLVADMDEYAAALNGETHLRGPDGGFSGWAPEWKKRGPDIWDKVPKSDPRFVKATADEVAQLAGDPLSREVARRMRTAGGVDALKAEFWGNGAAEGTQPTRLFRRHTPGMPIEASARPQGLYFNTIDDPRRFVSYHGDDEEIGAVVRALDDEVLDASDARDVGSAGLRALLKIVGDDEYESLLRLSPEGMFARLEAEFPQRDWRALYADFNPRDYTAGSVGGMSRDDLLASFLREAYAGEVARSRGYKGIVVRDADPGEGQWWNANEFVALSDDAFEVVRQSEIPGRWENVLGGGKFSAFKPIPEGAGDELAAHWDEFFGAGGRTASGGLRGATSGLQRLRLKMAESDRRAQVLLNRAGSDRYVDSIVNRLRYKTADRPELLDLVADGELHITTAGKAGKATGKVEPGSLVRASDRNNVGQVVSIDGDRARVMFTNKAEQTQATVDLPVSSLSPVKAAKARSGVESSPELRGFIADNLDSWSDDKVMKIQLSHGERGASERLDHAVSWIFSNLMSERTNNLSRSNTFKQFYAQRIEELTPFMDADARVRMAAWAREQKLPDVAKRIDALSAKHAVTDTAIDFDKAEHIAKGFGLDQTRDLLYDMSQKSQFFDAYRLIFPFGEAWKEMVTRWAKIGAERPQALRRGQQLVTGARDAGFFYVNENGEEVYAYPGSEWISEKLTGVPVPLTGRVAGLSLMTEVLPGVGPVVQFPAAAFLPDKPEWDWARDVIFPFAEPDTSGGVIESLLPAWAQKWRTGFAGGNERMFNGAVMDVARYLVSTGEYDTSTVDGINALLDEAKKKARTVFALRGAAQFFAPSAPTPEWQVEDRNGDLHVALTLTREYHDLLDKDPQNATQAMLDKYGPDLFLLLQGKTAEVVPGAPITNEGADWERANSGVVASHPLVFGFFAPQGDGIDSAAFNRQMSQGRRVAISPDQSVRLGNNRVANAIYQNAKRKMGPSLNRAQQTWLRGLRAVLVEQYPGFGERVGVPENASVESLVAGLEAAVADERLSDNPNLVPIRQYLAAREKAQAAATEAGFASFRDAAAMGGVRAWLRGLADLLVRDHPGFELAYSRVFDREMADDVEVAA